MMKDIVPTPGRPDGEDRIILVATREQYWLLEGEEFLDAMLAGQEDFPKPVICVVFEDGYALNSFLPEGVGVTKLWAINPAIVDRLRSEGELDERSEHDL